MVHLVHLTRPQLLCLLKVASDLSVICGKCNQHAKSIYCQSLLMGFQPHCNCLGDQGGAFRMILRLPWYIWLILPVLACNIKAVTGGLLNHYFGSNFWLYPRYTSPTVLHKSTKCRYVFQTLSNRLSELRLLDKINKL